MLKISIKEKVNQEITNILNRLQCDHSDCVEGIYDLYSSLVLNGSCASYKSERIYYVAYTLAMQGIDFTIGD